MMFNDWPSIILTHIHTLKLNFTDFTRFNTIDTPIPIEFYSKFNSKESWTYESENVAINRKNSQNGPLGRSRRVVKNDRTLQIRVFNKLELYQSALPISWQNN